LKGFVDGNLHSITKNSIYKTLQQLVLVSAMPKILIFIPIHLIVTSPKYELAVRAQLVEALHRNRRAAGSIPARGLTVSFFATAPSKVK
jgi:hypothetical protein